MILVNSSDWNKNRRVFKDIHCLGYPFYHVHPHKQISAYNLCFHVPEQVHYVIVFGSSVHPWHQHYKDLDVCLIGKKMPDDVSFRDMKTQTHGYDFLSYEIDEFLRKINEINSVCFDIKNEGVLIYEKSVLGFNGFYSVCSTMVWP